MFENIPQWLRGGADGKEYNIFCTHKDKVPTHGTHVDDMDTYHTFSECQKLMTPEEGLGIGMFGNLCGIDIDHCIHDGKIAFTAAKILQYFDGAYVEKSFSGTGIHILFFCKEQHKYQKYYTKMNEKHLQDKGITDIGGLELYQGRVDNRYLTLTGNIIPVKNPNNYTVSPKKIQAFLDMYFQRPAAPVVTHAAFTSSDAEDIAWFNWARNRKPDKLMELASKTPTGSGGTESEDDLIFMSELAFWCNKNPKVMRKAFESSYYYQHKDDKHIKKWARKDYSEGVISKAMSNNNVAKLYYEGKYAYDETTKMIKEVI
ncbi:MAG: hypothetical protein K6G38_06455 [Gammaproteobacteria bacterium]|nr:hypothetical protein [Gammaproteobacteria bacterium]